MLKKEVLDKSEYYLDLESSKDFIDQGYRLSSSVYISCFKRIIVCGMGGSGIIGDLLKAVIDIPVEVVKGYTLPSDIDSSCLAFLISYSGNTEETLNCLQQALKLKCKIVAMSCGGKLKEMALRRNIEHILVPYGHQPRAMLYYMFFSVLRTLENCEKCDFESSVKRITRMKINTHKDEIIANKLFKKIPLIYSSLNYYSVALRFKEQLNENSKIHAFCNSFSEMNHNEIEGFEILNGNYIVVFIRNLDDHPRINKRFQILKEILLSKKIEVIEINSVGSSKLERMFNTIIHCDWISYYLAVLNKVNPSEIKLIESLKKKL